MFDTVVIVQEMLIFTSVVIINIVTMWQIPEGSLGLGALSSSGRKEPTGD